jgi:hypothetical protein
LLFWLLAAIQKTSCPCYRDPNPKSPIRYPGWNSRQQHLQLCLRLSGVSLLQDSMQKLHFGWFVSVEPSLAGWEGDGKLSTCFGLEQKRGKSVDQIFRAHGTRVSL